ncbi:DNA cytosine methyltransferase [Streptomyces tauricus]|uniref:DNA (cytosine-5-)-methyltransferase n=1 Tax=Streptomyces tauricus TaxID=68274 RepID=A0ABZ1JLR5_9ACTN|nr:DNA cytosine methyltransferase [Streptomyces tauricus]MCW8098553.1 DNA cytosine methyltransferase [Streptomyces tauricus]
MTHAPLPPLDPAHVRIVDLFAGPGGLDIAASIMELECIGVEWDAATRATRDAAGIKHTEQRDVAEIGPCDPQVVDANVLTGGPPCQTFSVAGNREGHKALEDVKRLATRLASPRTSEAFDAVWEDVQKETTQVRDDTGEAPDPRTGLVLQPLRWIMEAKLKRRKPYEVVVLEQVPTVLPVWKHYAELLRTLGYAADAHVLQAECYGVAQTRRRAVLIARYAPDSVDSKVPFPERTHQLYRPGVERLPTQDEQAADAPSTLFTHDVKGWTAMQDVLPDRPSDFVVVSNYGSGGDPKKRGRRTSEEPAATVTGKVRRNRVFHLKETRDGRKEIGEELERLSLREAGLLQSFPAAYPWRSTDGAQQIGNAIPPRLAVHILSTALGLGKPDNSLFTALQEWKPPSQHGDATVEAG